jgi:hypothetical protein
MYFLITIALIFVAFHSIHLFYYVSFTVKCVAISPGESHKNVCVYPVLNVDLEVG